MSQVRDRRDRELTWEGCVNVRDLGGHLTEDGGETRFGVYVRADSLDRLTDAGWEALVEYGVRTIVDLRLAEERTAERPTGHPIVALHRPLLPDFGHPDWEAINQLARGLELPESMRVVYLEFLERYGDRFAEAVSTIVDAGESGDGAVLFHCMIGKDRTGLVAALLLRVAGVGREAVAADYALSERNLEAHLSTWIATAESDEDRRRRARVGASPAEAMLGVLETLDDRYGGAAGYLRAAGVDDRRLATARIRLRG